MSSSSSQIWAQTSISHWLTIVSYSASSLSAIIVFSRYHSGQDTPLVKFFDSLFGGRGKLKCKDLMVKLVYLSCLIFCKPIFNSSLTVHYLLKPVSIPQSLYSSNVFVDVINFLLGTPFPQPSLITWPIPTLPSRLTKPSWSHELSVLQISPQKHLAFILIGALICILCLLVEQHSQHLV